MGKYGDAALWAIRLIKTGEAPNTAWNMATHQFFPNSPSSQKKPCPKGAFLGLCEDRLVTGVAAGRYTNSKDNKKYAVKAVALLRINPMLAQDENNLWRAVIEGQKHNNQQMDVVLRLWNNDLIIKEVTY
jgi:hypothetical protein